MSRNTSVVTLANGRQLRVGALTIGQVLALQRALAADNEPGRLRSLRAMLTACAQAITAGGHPISADELAPLMTIPDLHVVAAALEKVTAQAAARAGAAIPPGALLPN